MQQTFTLTEDQLRNAVAQYLYDEGLTEITDGTMEMTIFDDNSLEGILTNTEVKKFFDSTNQFTSAHDCCKIQCGVKNG